MVYGKSREPYQTTLCRHFVAAVDSLVLHGVENPDNSVSVSYFKTLGNSYLSFVDCCSIDDTISRICSLYFRHTFERVIESIAQFGISECAAFHDVDYKFSVDIDSLGGTRDYSINHVYHSVSINDLYPIMLLVEIFDRIVYKTTNYSCNRISTLHIKNLVIPGCGREYFQKLLLKAPGLQVSTKSDIESAISRIEFTEAQSSSLMYKLLLNELSGICEEF